MAKGYWIGQVTVHDPDRYKDYVAANKLAFDAYGAQFLVRGGTHETCEGRARDRHVIIEFDSFAAARACYDSPEYAAAKTIRETCSEGDIVIVEGI